MSWRVRSLWLSAFASLRASSGLMSSPIHILAYASSTVRRARTGFGVGGAILLVFITVVVPGVILSAVMLPLWTFR